MRKNTWKDYFTFTKRDRTAVFILLLIIAILMALPYVLPAKKLDIHIDAALQKEFDSLRQNEKYASSEPVNNFSSADTTIHGSVKKELFYFDPNILSEDGFVKLGLPAKTIHTLINYRSKGGYFKTPEDIRKIYGLSKADADRLIPYIRIASSNTKQKEDDKKYEQPAPTTASHQYKKININTATAENWKAFPGIGDVIANRIVKFRTSIGGFKTIEQVGKTYGLNDSVFQQIKPYLYLKDSVNN